MSDSAKYILFWKKTTGLSFTPFIKTLREFVDKLADDDLQENFPKMSF